jgi:hypothetical protein
LVGDGLDLDSAIFGWRFVWVGFISTENILSRYRLDWFLRIEVTESIHFFVARHACLREVAMRATRVSKHPWRRSRYDEQASMEVAA